jgi:hypothetical protein
MSIIIIIIIIINITKNTLDFVLVCTYNKRVMLNTTLSFHNFFFFLKQRLIQELIDTTTSVQCNEVR